jgi:hypothetical protein
MDRLIVRVFWIWRSRRVSGYNLLRKKFIKMGLDNSGPKAWWVRRKWERNQGMSGVSKYRCACYWVFCLWLLSLKFRAFIGQTFRGKFALVWLLWPSDHQEIWGKWPTLGRGEWEEKMVRATTIYFKIFFIIRF